MEYLNRLRGRSKHTSCKCPVSANSICITSCEKWDLPCDRPRLGVCLTHGLKSANLWRVLAPDSQSLFSDFTIQELTFALQHLKPGKAAGPDSICPELILHAGSEMKSWLCEFLSSCLLNLKTPKIWRKALLVAILEPNKPPRYPKCYRPISKSWSILFMPVLSPPSTHFSLVLAWEINCRSNHYFADSRHQESFFGEK